MINLFSPERSFAHYRQAILNHNINAESIPNDFLLAESDDEKLREYYIPFDYVNTNAKVILCGLTPGRAQWFNAVQEAKRALLENNDDAATLIRAKQTGAFSGSMRSRLVEMLDLIGLNKALNIDSTDQAFEPDAQLIHFTSVLNQPILENKGGRWTNYNALSVPNVKKNFFFTRSIMEGILKEINAMPDTPIFVLGTPCTKIFKQLVEANEVDPKRVFAGVPHPSGANNERVAVFLNKKDPSKASRRTNPAEIYANRELLIQRIKDWPFK